jgi:hypothetical protein
MKNTHEFIDCAFSLAKNGGVKCPCSKCRNFVCEDKRTLSVHLCKVSFMPGYHDESVHQTTSVAEDGDTMSDDRMDEMLDTIWSEFGTNLEDPHTIEVQKFVNILKASEEPLHKHMTVSVLTFVTHLYYSLQPSTCSLHEI